MRNDKWDLIACILLVVFLSFVVGFIGGRQHAYRRAVQGFKTKTDTLYVETEKAVKTPENDLAATEVVKTVRVPFPVPVPDSISMRRADSLLARVGRLETENDSLYLVLQREQKVYSSDEYTAWVSGYDPALDSLKFKAVEKIITVEHFPEARKKVRWGLGVQAGYGASRDGLTPYVGVGLTYNILSW